jgi:hypothetical protein
MPVWYVAVYTSTSRYEKLIPVYTGVYLDVRNRLVLSRWSGFQMVAALEIVWKLLVNVKKFDQFNGFGFGMQAHRVISESVPRNYFN